MKDLEKEYLLKLIGHRIDTAKTDVSYFEFLTDEEIKELVEFIHKEISYLQGVHAASFSMSMIYDKALFDDYYTFREKLLKKEKELLSRHLRL
jgi:hypothetical protein